MKSDVKYIRNMPEGETNSHLVTTWVLLPSSQGNYHLRLKPNPQLLCEFHGDMRSYGILFEY